MDEADELDDYELPYPPEGWWHATLGVALHDAYSGYEHGIAYFGLDDIEPPRKSELDLAQWRSLRQARRTGIAVVDAVRSLVTRHADAAPTLPPGVEDSQNLAIQRALWMMSREDLSSERPEPPDSIEHPSTSQYLLATTIVLGITRLLPGIKWEPLDYGFGYTSVNTDRVLVGRVRTLLRYVRTGVPERTARYLSNIALCYLFSLDAEMAVMARAAIEAAIEEVVDEDDVVEKLGKPRGRVGLAQFIDYCYAVEIFDKDTRNAAERLKRAGDDAIHKLPELGPGNPDATLEDLTRVLDALESARRTGP